MFPAYPKTETETYRDGEPNPRPAPEIANRGGATEIARSQRPHGDSQRSPVVGGSAPDFLPLRGDETVSGMRPPA